MSLTTVEERDYMTHVSYTRAFGNLIYAMVCTRSDLSQSVSMVTRCMHDPDMDHGRQKSGSTMHQRYRRCWFGIQEGYYGQARVYQIHWFRLRRRPRQAPVYNMVYFCTGSSTRLSTTEAEYMVITEAMKEAIWLQGLLDDLEIDQDLLKIICVSMSAIYFAKN